MKIFLTSSIRLEHSDWVGGEVVVNQDVVIRINEEVVGFRKLTTKNMTNKIALRIKNGNKSIAGFTNSNISIRHQANATWIGKLTISISRRSKFPQELTI